MVSLRQFRSEDLSALYAISLATGHLGGDASHLYSDPNLMGHIYSAPYALLNPTLVLVAVDGDGVAGFVLGALDTAAWEVMLERNWWPALRAQYPDPGDTSDATWTTDQRRAFMIHHPERGPPAVTNAYPAHLHMNLLPRAQGRGVGSMLLGEWLRRAAKCQAKAIHVGVNRANLRAIHFWDRHGFKELTRVDTTRNRTMWMGRS